MPQGWNTAVGLAADLQLASAFPRTDIIEYLTGSPFIDEITVGGWHLDPVGILAIPTKPGLGLTLDRDALRNIRGARSSWIEPQATCEGPKNSVHPRPAVV